MARVRELHDRVPVDAVVQREPHVLVFQRGEVLVELDEVDARRGEQVALETRVLAIWSMRLPGGFSIASTFLLCSKSTRVLSLVTIWIFTFLIFGFLPYQFGFAAQVDLRVLVQARDHERPARDRLVEELVALRLDELLGHDRVGVHRKIGEQRRVRARHLDHERVRVGRFHAGHAVEQEPPAALQVLRPQDRVRGVLGGERRAVAELRRAQLERVGLPAVRDLPRRRQIGQQLRRRRVRLDAAGCRCSG